MCETGVTQEQIDETRLTTENAMLSDMQNILNDGGSFEFHGQTGETPVMQELLSFCKNIGILKCMLIHFKKDINS